MVNKHFSNPRTDSELEALKTLKELLDSNLNEFGDLWNVHLSLYLRRQTISRLLYYQHLYEKIVDVHGVILELGVQWGSGMASLINLRGIHEPYNFSRKIIGFDTFAGFPRLSREDGNFAQPKDNAVTKNYETLLEQILQIHESFSPLSHIKKYELVKGDVCETLPKWIADNPHAVFSMVIFDMDLFTPTKVGLSCVLPRMPKGAILVFDELCSPAWPGETRAVLEGVGLNNFKLRRFPHQPYCSYAVIGE